MWGRERNKNPFFMNSSPVMTMVLQPGVQAPRNHGTIPMDARLWDRPPPPGAQERILTRREKAVPKRIQQISHSSSGTNTGRDSFTQTQPQARPRPRPEPTPPPALDLKDVQCQTPKRPTPRPMSAPSKKPKPNPILGEGGQRGGFGGGGYGLQPLRPASGGIKGYNTMKDKHMVDFYKKKFGLTDKKGKKVRGQIKYKVRVETGDMKGAGTEARVYLTLIGSKGQSKKQRIYKISGNGQQDPDLCPFKFSRGSAHTFGINLKNVGVLEKIIIEHDGYEESASWFLKSVAITPEDSPETYLFNCEKWLSLYRGDCQISRELIAVRGKKLQKTKYEIVVITGDRVGAGTDANVFITLYGKRGQTEKCPLISKTVDTFERGQSDVFVIPGVDVGGIKKVRIEQDGRGRGSDWFLERLVVTNQIRPNDKQYFYCGAWLNDKEGMFRDLVGTSDPSQKAQLTNYSIKITTGDFRGAGTDADVYLTVFGDMGDTGKKYLDNRMENNFERGKTDTFLLKLPSVGIPDKIRIGHNNKGPKPGWYLEKVDIEVEGKPYEFICQRWFAKSEDDGKIEREFQLGGREDIYIHKVSVYTGEERNAGTDANVWVQLFSEAGEDSGRVELQGKWERKDVDHNNLELADNFSPIKYIHVGHDNSGRGPGWFLDKVVIYSNTTGLEQTFDCGEWLEQSKDNSSQRKLMETKSKRRYLGEGHGYVAKFWTSEVRGAGTNANVFVQVYDVQGNRSDELPLDNQTDNFEKGQMDRFTLDLPPDFEQLYKIRVWHDGSRPMAGWHLDRVELSKANTDEVYEFFCDKWLATDEDDGQILRELPATGKKVKTPGELKDYKVIVKTGDVFGAGTDANVYVILYGLGDSGKRALEKSQNRNKFERKNVDEFILQAVDLKDINHIQIGHDNWGGNAGWFCDSVEVADVATGISQEFICGRWLDQRKEDGKIIRDLYLDGNEMLHTTRYTIRVKTSDILNSGTNANVSLKIYGEDGTTELMPLKLNENRIRDKFERGQVDIFHMEAPNVGDITKILLGHDGRGLKDGWHVEYLELEVPEIGKAYMFTVNRWFASDEDDNETWRELAPTETANRDGTIPYQIEVTTGDVRFAGTDANVFLQIYGEDGKTEEKVLNDRSDNFERGKVDQFKIEDVDVGKISKIRIGHDDSKVGSAWNLDRVVISTKNGKGEVEKTIFVCGKWFDKKKDDKQIVRELLPTDESGNPVGDINEVEYKIEVVTGDERGCGTNANVFITLTGENGDSGERQLSSSENFNKFERNQTDIFTLKAAELGELTSLRIRHDNSGFKSGWYVDHVKVSGPGMSEQMAFPCKRWLAVDEDDGQVERSLIPIPVSQWQNKGRNSIALEQKAAVDTFNISVKTGDRRGAGTDANVYIQLFGENDDSGKIQLKTSNNRNKWERDQLDQFSVEAINLGDLKKIRLGHDNEGFKSGWYVSYVEIECPGEGKAWRFPVGRWFAKDEEDQLIERDLYPDEGDTEVVVPKIPYEISVYTTDNRGSGTNANVYVQLFGEDGSSTDQIFLCPDKFERRQKFEAGNCDIFTFELTNVGPIEKLRIGHDDSGFKSGWHLDKVVIRTMNDVKDIAAGSEETVFSANRWLASDELDKRIELDLLPGGTLLETKTYTIKVFTGDKMGAGTNSNVFVKLLGENGESPDFPLLESENRNKFERGQLDSFTVTNPDLGQVFKMVIRHDNSGILGSDWFLGSVEVSDGENEPAIFPAEKWLKDKKISRTLYIKGYDPEKMTSKSTMSAMSSSSGRSIGKSEFEGPATKYEIRIKTGSIPGSSSTTEPDAYIRFYGKSDEIIEYEPTQDRQSGRRSSTASSVENEKSTKRINLPIPTGQDKFVKDSVDSWTFENMDVGELTKVELGVRNLDESWFVELLEVHLPLKAKTYFFKVNNWYCKTEGDGLLNRVFNAEDALPIEEGTAKTAYEVSVITADESDAGLDEGDVYLTFTGESKTISDVKLERSEESFSRAGRDIFDLDLEDVEPMKMVTAKVSTDNVEGGGIFGRREKNVKWFCEKIEVRNKSSGKIYVFNGTEWAEGGQTVQLMPRGSAKFVDYEIEVKTSDLFGCGTDANVDCEIVGQNGTSGVWSLAKGNNDDPFERNQTDIFKFPNKPDLGELATMRIQHDNKGFKSGWHLEHVRVKANGKEWFFPCGQWLAKTEGDRQIMRELIPTNIKKGSSNNEKMEYNFTVSCADVKNAGTTESLKLKLIGSAGSTDMRLRNPLGLKKGESRRFDPETSKDVGELQEIGISLDGSRAEKTYISTVEAVFGGNKYLAIVDDWVDRQGITASATLEDGIDKQRKRQNLSYSVAVSTCDERKAGTDANVKLTIYGTLGNSGKMPLEQRWRDLFERGNTDNFEINCLDLGELEKIKLEHDDKGRNADWKPKNVIISTPSNTWTFPCGSWIGRKKGKGLEEEFRVAPKI